MPAEAVEVHTRGSQGVWALPPALHHPGTVSQDFVEPFLGVLHFLLLALLLQVLSVQGVSQPKHNALEKLIGSGQPPVPEETHKGALISTILTLSSL